MFTKTDSAEMTEAVRHKNIDNLKEETADLLIRVLDFAGGMGFNLDKLVKDKREYNKTRPYKHGGYI